MRILLVENNPDFKEYSREGIESRFPSAIVIAHEHAQPAIQAMATDKWFDVVITNVLVPWSPVSINDVSPGGAQNFQWTCGGLWIIQKLKESCAINKTDLPHIVICTQVAETEMPSGMLAGVPYSYVLRTPDLNPLLDMLAKMEI